MRSHGEPAAGPGGGPAARPGRLPRPGRVSRSGPAARPPGPEPLPDPGREHRARWRAALGRSPRTRVEVTFNELTGTMSWRVPTDGRRGRPERGRGGGGPSVTARAAALRSAGVGPSGTPVEGAAPIPVPPSAVRAVADAPADTFTADRRGGHLARTALLRSRVQGDLSGVARMPSAVAARLRTTTVPAHLGALSAARATVGRPGPDARGRATPAPSRSGPVRR